MKQRKMTNRQRERAQLAFLSDAPDWNPSSIIRRKIGDVWRDTFDDAPDWYGVEYGLEYRTVIGSAFDASAPVLPRGWMHVGTFTHGERGCPWCGPGTGNEDGREDCDLCEGFGYVCDEYGCSHVYARALKL